MPEVGLDLSLPPFLGGLVAGLRGAASATGEETRLAGLRGHSSREKACLWSRPVLWADGREHGHIHAK